MLDDLGEEVAIGQPGELCIRGGFMIGYWNEPEKTAEAKRDGWLHTGDVGRMDAGGFITTLGRVSERIESPTGPTYPRPIEEALQRHPSVRYAAVIPVDAQPVAVVTLWPQADTVDAPTLRVFYDAQPDADARLSSIEMIIDMPMTPTGKLDKITLRKRFSGG